MASPGFDHRSFEKLKHDNWFNWKFRINTALKEKKLIKYLTSEPDENNKDEDVKALSLISNAVGDEQVQHIRDAETTKAAWDALVKVNESGSFAATVFLFRTFVEIRQSPDEPVSDHIQAMKDIYNKLNGMGAQIPQRQFIIILLSSVHSKFNDCVRTLEKDASQEVTLTEVVARLIAEDTRLKLQSKTTETAIALYANSQRQKGRNVRFDRNKGLKCEHCQKPGHTKDECWSLHPEKRPQRNKPYKGNNNKNTSREYGLTLTESMKPRSGHWIIDSGATSHMCNNEASFIEYRDLMSEGRTLTNANGGKVHIAGTGTVKINVRVDKRVNILRLHDVLHVPDLDKNLFSVSKAMDKNVQLSFSGFTAVMQTSDNETVARAHQEGNLWVIDIVHDEANAVTNAITETALWHERMGHLNIGSMKTMAREQMVRGLDITPKDMGKCEVCLQAKMTHLPFPSRESKSSQPLEVVHSDVCGPFREPSLSGARYVVTFIDDYSRYTTVYFLKTKDEVLDRFVAYKTMAERQTGHQLKTLRSDRGGEYMGKTFASYLEQHGIIHDPTPPYSPQSNGIAERMNRTLVEMARCMIHGKNLPQNFWAEAINTATYIRNRSESSALNKVTPYEAWTGRKPSIRHLRIFGSKCYALDTNPGRSKLAPKGIPCLLLGYDGQSKSYRLWDQEKRKVKISRDVQFNEHDTSLRPLEHNIVHIHPDPDPEKEIPITMEVPTEEASEEPSEVAQQPQQLEQQTQDTPEEGQINTPDTQSEKNLIAQLPRPRVLTDEMLLALPNASLSREEQYRRLTLRASRIREAADERERRKMATRSSTEQANVVAETEPDEPMTYKQAIHGPNADKWAKAIDEELQSLEKNDTWELVPRPTDAKILPSRWIFKLKKDEQGNIARYKARFVVKGYVQEQGIDYDETFAPVVKATSIRTLLALAVNKNLHLHQMDVSTAFLNGDIDREIFVEPPQGLETNGQVCLLKRTLYGLKQSPRGWNHALDAFLTTLGLERLVTDNCLYVNRDRTTYLAVYVDDLLLATESEQEMAELKEKFSDRFEMKDLGPAKYVLGLEIDYDQEGGTLCLHQSNYIRNILQTFNMDHSKPVASPMDPSVKLRKNDTEENNRAFPYREAIGKLMYAATSTRLDISYAVGHLSRYLDNPSDDHWNAVKRILRYLKGTQNHGLIYNRTYTHWNLELYCDSDWASDIDSRKSTAGFISFFNGSPISWKSKLQSTVALSSTEAEYMGLTQASKECLWLQMFLDELGITNIMPTTIHCDNQAAIQIAHNPVHHERSKHIDIRFHFIRNLIDDRIILQYCPTTKMLADVMTKALNGPKHTTLVQDSKLRALV